MRKIKISSFHMIKNSASGSYKNINSSSQLVNLLVYGHSTIHCEDIVLSIVMLQVVEDSRNLQSQFPGWRQYNTLNISWAKELVSSQVFHGG